MPSLLAGGFLASFILYSDCCRAVKLIGSNGMVCLSLVSLFLNLAIVAAFVEFYWVLLLIVLDLLSYTDIVCSFTTLIHKLTLT